MVCACEWKEDRTSSKDIHFIIRSILFSCSAPLWVINVRLKIDFDDAYNDEMTDFDRSILQP